MDANDFYQADQEYRRYMREREWKYCSKSEDSVSICDSKRSFTLNHFRQVKAAKGILPLPNGRPQTAPAVLGSKLSILGYTGHRPRKSVPHIGRAVSPLKYKISGYTGHIPEGCDPKRSDDGPVNLPVCKHYKYHQTPRNKPSAAQVEATKKRYDENIAVLESRGLTAMGVLNIVQNKLQERVTSTAQQEIRISRMFEYFDFNDNKALEEDEFKKFLEYCSCFLDDVQFLALFSLFDVDYSSGLCWQEFRRHAMVVDPKGGTAILPKAITNDYGDRRVRTIRNIFSGRNRDNN